MINLLSPEVLSGVGTVISGVLGAWNTRQGKAIRNLQREVGELTTWRTVATQYIGTLLWALITRGITPPAPPASLGLVPPVPTTPAPTPGPLPPDQATVHDAAQGTAVPQTRS